MIKAALKHFYNATLHSFSGFKAAYEAELPFRLEIYFGFIALPAAAFIATSLLQYALLVGCWFAVLFAEIVNSAIEATVDRISTEIHPLSKRAKDLGSAAVFIACLNAAVVWSLMIASRLLK